MNHRSFDAEVADQHVATIAQQAERHGAQAQQRQQLRQSGFAFYIDEIIRRAAYFDRRITRERF
jgi:hypothetical protein